MNKAFERDPEPRDPTCPEPRGCGSAGIPVDAETLRAQLPDAVTRQFAGHACYCPNPACDVAYFDAWGAAVSLDQVRSPAYPKPPTAPLCNCFGISAEAIIEEAEQGCRDRIRALVASAESGAARCATRAPSGRSCAAEARRLFLAHFKPA